LVGKASPYKTSEKPNRKPQKKTKSSTKNGTEKKKARKEKDGSKVQPTKKKKRDKITKRNSEGEGRDFVEKKREGGPAQKTATGGQKIGHVGERGDELGQTA